MTHRFFARRGHASPTASRLLPRALCAFCLAAVVVFVATGCGGGEESGAASGGSLVVAWPSEPRNLDVTFVQDALNHPIAVNVYEGLTRLDKDNNVVPLLATTWERTNPNTWRFELREGVKFHNGEQFTPETVVFNVDRAIDEESENLSYFGAIESARSAGDNAVEIVTSAPDPNVPRELVFLMMTPPEFVQNEGNTFLRKAVGTGPYIFDTWKRGQSMTLSANEEYWGEKPKFDEVTFRVIPDSGVRLQALKAGEVQMARNLSPDQAPQAPKVFAEISNEVCFIRLTNQKGGLEDIRVRQAANYAIDRETLVQQLFGEYAVLPQAQLVTEASFGYDNSLTDYAYDPERAKELLAGSSYENQPIKIVGESAGRWTGDRELVLATVDQLRSVGINAQADIREWQLYLNAIFKEPRADALFVCASDDNLTGQRVLQSFATTQGVQSTYRDPEAEAMLVDATSTFDDAARADKLGAIWRKLKDDAAFIPLASVMNIWGATTDIEWQPRKDDVLYLDEVVVGSD